MKLFGIGALAAVVLGCGAAQAALIDPVSVEYSPGLNVPTPRTIFENVLDTKSKTVLSLGKGGSAIFDFGTKFSGSLNVVELTYDMGKHDEIIELFGLIGTAETYLGRIINTAAQIASGGATLTFDGVFEKLLVRDVSRTTADGFDIDRIRVMAFEGGGELPDSGSGETPVVPLPGAGVLLLAGIGGLAALRRRGKAG